MREAKVLSKRKVESKSKEEFIDLVLDTMKLDKQLLVFTNSKSGSEKSAENIYLSLPKTVETTELRKISEDILKAVSTPTKQCRRLAKIITRGVAFHHSGLVAKQRSLIEKAFRSGLIKVICSTPTLAAGLNMPAYKVIVKDYKRYSPRGFRDIPVLEYHQMSGRAGRPGIEDKGLSVIHVKNEEELERVVNKYVFGDSEEIVSKLAVEPTLKMYILSLISMGMVNSKEEISSFFSNTLYAHQYQDMDALEHHIFSILGQLKNYDFVEEQEEDYYIATPMGKRVSQLYLNPDTANYFLSSIDKFFKEFKTENPSRQSIYSLLFFVVNTMEMRPLFRVAKKDEETYVKRAEEQGDLLTVGFDPFEGDYSEFLSALKTTDIFQDWILEAHEEYLNEKYNVTPGEVNYKLDVLDWLLYCIEEIALLKKNFFFKNYINKLRIRVKIGVKEELLSLISLSGVGRVRARKLYNAGFKKLLDLKRSDINSISRVVGEATARKIKEQISDSSNESKTLIEEELDKPKELAIREVEDNEVESLLGHYEEFEEEKKKAKNLFDYF